MNKVSVTELKEIAFIEEIIGKYINIKKQGNLYKGLCPFHNEKTPSFIVNPEKKFYHCFGCGESGDVFSFLVKHNNMSFKDAVNEVADYYGVKIENKYFKHVDTNIKEKIIKMNNIALQEYKRLLHDSKTGYEIMEYLKNRKINEEIIKLFELGFITDEWGRIANLLTKSNFDNNDFDKCDLLIKNKTGKYHDRFRYRLMFPIFDEKDVLVGFGGREMGIGKTTGDNPAKYLNSSETELFKKRYNLYNLNLAKNEIKEKKSVILTEGYIDVITCYQYGFRNVVAPLGTSVTIEQLRMLEKYAEKLILVFDGDNAGQNATLKCIDLAFQTNMEIFVVRLPENSDPHDYLLENGKESFNKLLINAEDGLNYKINNLLISSNLETAKGKELFIKNSFNIVKNIRNIIIAELAIKKISELTELNEDILRKTFAKINKKSKKSNTSNNDTFIKETKEERFQNTIINSLLVNDINIEKYILLLQDDMFSNEFYKKIYLLMKELLITNENISKDLIYSSLEEDDQNEFVKIISDSKEFTYDTDKILIETINNLKLSMIENKIKSNNLKIKNAESNDDFDTLKTYLEEAQYLMNEKRKVLLKSN